MKKVILIVLAISLVLAGTAFATVVGSLHDLGTNGPIGSTNSGYGTGTGQVCVFCHHPHRGSVASLTTAILWNITDWDETSYAVYDNTGSTMNATDGAAVINDGTSNAYASYFCMACHDGTVGADALVREPRDGTGNTTPQTLDAGANLGTTLEDDHPVNFTYSLASGPDAEIIAIGSTTNGLGQNYELFSLKMQCATCHDVHRGALTTAGCASTDANSCDPNIEFMLQTTANSLICIDCHVK